MSNSQTEFPHPGVAVRTNPHGIKLVFLHYSADPDKGNGEKTVVPELGLALSPWALAQYRGMTKKEMYLQEYEIDFGATQGQKVYHLDKEATLCQSFPIPPSWTRYFSIDPHPAVPHACLWGAVDPWGDLWIYRELWPSRAYGKPGPCPADDNRYRIRHYVETIYYLESKENPQNEYNGERFDEAVYEREIDYAVRAFGKGTSDDPEQPNFQQRFEQKARELAEELDVDWELRFKDAKKDRGVGEDCVNEYLLPREVDDGVDGFRKSSRLHIFEDRCPELIYELDTVRRQTLSPLQVERMDPTGEPVDVRKHMTDNLRYLCMANPTYVPPRGATEGFRQATPGIAY